MNKEILIQKNKIRYLRVILTNQCNFYCQGCHKEGQVHNSKVNIEEYIRIIIACINIGMRKIKLMGGEPTLVDGLYDIIYRIKEKEQKVDLSMISNGTANMEVYDKCFENGLDRLNLSIHGFEIGYFLDNTRMNEQIWLKMRNNLDVLQGDGKINKINYVLKKNVNEKDLLDLLEWLGTYKHKKIDILNYLTMDPNEMKYTYRMEEIEEFLEKEIGIESIKRVENKYSLDSKHVILKNGVEVNLKTSELKNEDFLKSCKECKVKEFCKEGISAVRLCTDYRIQPCLYRMDNCLKVNPNAENLEEYLITYLNRI